MAKHSKHPWTLFNLVTVILFAPVWFPLAAIMDWRQNRREKRREDENRE